jgi:hypothetical protein
MPRSNVSLAQQLLDDVALMSRYAASAGLRGPKRAAGLLTRIGTSADAYLAPRQGEAGPAAERLRDLEELSALHAQLSRLVAPATPRSLRETENADGLLSTLVNVRLLRYMTIIGLLSLIGYGALLCCPDPGQGFLYQSKLLIAAALGASFYALYTAQRYVAEKTFDSRFVPTYFVRFILGLIAGPILANLAVRLEWVGGGAGDSSIWTDLGPNTIALVGGYSADVLNQILNRLMQVVTSFAKGDEREAARGKEEQLRAELATALRAEKQQLARLVMDARNAAPDAPTRAALDEALARLGADD